MPPPPLKRIIKRGYFFFNNLLFYWYRKKINNPTHPKSPLNPWAFIRVCNEKDTLEQSLNSIVGAISRGIIVYNECDDGSDEIIKKFCAKHKGFIYAEYPYKVARVRHYEGELKTKKSLGDYYNFALSFIPQNEWLIKIDTDQIYDAKKLKESFNLIKHQNDIVFYFRINLHIFDQRIYLQKDSPIFDPKDHWLICNQRLFFVDSIQWEKDNEVFYWESLCIPFVYRGFDARLNTWHFPLLKSSRREGAKIQDFIPLKNYKEIISQEYLDKIDEDMLDEQRILNFFDKKGL
ncbi:beta-1,4-N-acetylgalactosamyltransferase [Helicobacter anseris]|uniref:Beta-1,4-N-acetylgalactosamyltransferase n=1 Tax=Helicobacter anseris TaxID=375926 RepID=A0A3D8J9P7_9HELI|nr:beta-1,4-N-acetylgalactosamyltransferase [Helicobacter anseris]